MWKTISWHDKLILIKIEILNNELKITLTNFIKTWGKIYLKQEIFDKFAVCMY